MNSFLFNISIVLLGSMAVTQFVSDCLCDYVAFTDIDALFNTLIKNLKFFKYFYRNHVFQYIFFGIFVISFIYMIYQLCKTKESIKHKSLINEEKNKNKKKEKNKKKIDEKIIVDDKKNKKNKDKETENSDSSDKIKGKKNTSEEKLDIDNEININNDNNNKNEANSFEDDDY